MRIPISEIKINPERRKADPAHIKELSKSIADVGLLNPITVNEDHTLIAGLHRLEAAKLLGWTEIECTVCGIDSIRAELAEIDENVIRRNLTNTELNDLLARRKKLYETLHPETIARNRPGHVSNHQGSSDKLSPESKVKSFVEDTAEKLGVSARTVERHLYLAEHLTPKVSEILKKMDKQPPRCELMKLARLEPGQQEECAALFMSGEIKSVDTYLKQGKLETTETDVSSSFDGFIERLSLILNEVEQLSALLAENSGFTDEQKSTARMQAAKLHEAAGRLIAQLEDGR